MLNRSYSAYIQFALLFSSLITICRSELGESASVPGDTSRQCECWIWPTCISNCTVNPILKLLFESKYEQIAKIRTPFIVIFPFQVRRAKTKKIYTNTLNKQGQYRLSTNFWVQLLNGEDVQLKLQKSRIFGNESISPNNYLLKYYQKSGEIVSNNLKKCFYTGSVILDQSNTAVPHSYVAVDTCDGLRGIIQNKGSVFGILPMKHPNSKENEPMAHFIYSETTSTIERVAKNLKSFWYNEFGIMSDSDIKNDNLIHVVPVSLVIDHTLMKIFQFDTEKASHFALSLLNEVTKSFMSMKLIELQLASIELWNLNDKFPISKFIKTTLNDFLKLRLKISDSNSVPRQHRGEMSILLSGVPFNEEVEYFSVPGSVCTKRSMSVVQVTSTDEVYHVSRLMSLSIAEMFGIDSFPCPESYSCSSKIVLSKGDESRLKLALLSGQANCLKKESTKNVIDTCGNGKIDRGEECDTISHPETSEELKCCDKQTCMVANYAQCNGGECCSSNCTFYSRGRICRPSKDQCDIPEFCIGDVDSCPQDLFLENGHPCNKGSALCYQGRCPTRDSKCESLWGQKSKEANQHCYTALNLNQVDSCGAKTKCTTENLMCGRLHCQGGSESLSDSKLLKNAQEKNQMVINSYLQFQKDKIQCKYLSNMELAYVEDGTECGRDKYCFGKTCSSLTSKIVSQCPKDSLKNETKESICFNRGICTNLGICLCHPGWSGRNCSVVANESTPVGEFGYAEQTKNYIWAYFKEIGMYNGTLYKDKDKRSSRGGGAIGILTTMHLIIILGSVIGLMFLVLTLFMICYRRKGSHKSKRTENYPFNGMKGEDKYDNSHYTDYVTEDGTRIIGRRQNSNVPTRKENDLKNDISIISGGKRRGRRHRRRSSNGSSNRRLCRDNGDGNESIGAVSDYGGQEHEWNRPRQGGAQSDNDLNASCLAGKMNDDLGNSIEKIIKFGNMPSYKEDKLNRSVNNSPSTNTNIASLSQDTDSSLLGRSSDPLLTNVSSPCNSESQCLLRSPTMAYQVSQPCSTYLASMPPSLSTSPLPIASPDKKDAMSFANKIFSPPFGLPAPALFPSIPYSSTPIVSAPVPSQDKVFDLSLKQPEKGILKNKSSSDLKEIPQTSKVHKGTHSCSKKNKRKHHCGTTTNDSNSATSPSSASQSSLSSCESNSLSCSSSSSSSSSGSSATSSLVTPPHGRRNHHKQKSGNRRSQNNPLPPPPTILCNASNQTDEFNNNLNPSNLRTNFKAPRQVLTNGEDEIEECDEEDCEECMKARAEHSNKSPPETLLTSNSSGYDIVGSADDGYHHYNQNNLRFNPDLSVHYDCHAIPPSHPQACYQGSSTNDEHSEQNSETEVDSHLQMLMSPTSHFYGNGGINKFIAPVPFPDANLISDPSLQRSQIPGQYNQPYNTLNTYPYYYVTAPNQMNENSSPHDNDDINSEVSISAYCRVPQTTCNKMPNDHLARLHPGATNSDTFSNTCFDGASNDGTVEGSDTSSLPDAHCDLVHLANLGIGPTRPNPMLSCLFRGQSTGKKGQEVLDPSSNILLPSPMWSPSRTDSRSPGHLPHPNTYTAGSDYLA